MQNNIASGGRKITMCLLGREEDGHGEGIGLAGVSSGNRR
jgi:hypothetical protein